MVRAVWLGVVAWALSGCAGEPDCKDTPEGCRDVPFGDTDTGTKADTDRFLPGTDTAHDSGLGGTGADTDGKPNDETDTDGVPDTDTDGVLDTDTDGVLDTDTDGVLDTDTDGVLDTDTDGVLDTDTDEAFATDTDADLHTDTDTDTDTDGSPVVPLPGFGAITGACGVLDDVEWLGSDAFRFASAVDFGTTPYDPSLHTAGGQQIISAGTIGGSSAPSEALAFDLLHRCEGANLLLTEGAIVYQNPNGKKTDMLVSMDGRNVGVSVTRALTFQFPDFCATPSVANLTPFLTGKVEDLALSEANADATNPWDHSVLAVIACDDAHATAIAQIFDGLDPSVRGDAILLVTTTDGDDAWLY